MRGGAARRARFPAMPASPVVEPETRSDPEERTRVAPRWNVVLLDDDDHTYAYVIEMLGKLFGHPPPTAWRMAREVDTTGRVIVWTDAREVCEPKQEQVHEYGADPLLPRCSGSMTAVLEPAE